MRRKFRYYTKQGWEIVTIPRANLYRWEDVEYGFGDKLYYSDMVKWCYKTFPDNVWDSMPQVGVGGSAEKCFAFKHPKHATMFRLKWAV